MGLTPAIWHAHEMLLGYAVAVVAGFLLTAINNWTGQQTIRGTGLLLMFTLWLTARLLSLNVIDVPIVVMAVFDLAFMLMLVVGTAYPVFKVKQYAQLGIISKVALMFMSNGLFYLGALGFVEAGIHWGLYSGLYLIIALLLVMARPLRVKLASSSLVSAIVCVREKLNGVVPSESVRLLLAIEIALSEPDSSLVTVRRYPEPS